jgi:hypothetical protein
MQRILVSLALLFMASAAFAAAPANSAATPTRAAAPADSGPAIKAADAWLARVDAGDYAESWKQASPLFQQQMTEPEWEKIIAKARRPMGKMMKRSTPTAQYTPEDPDSPGRQYWLIQYIADFQHQPGLVERVTLMPTASGWQVVGYRILTNTDTD